ncbi:MAG TPA: peptidylprolyl isomerase [Pseudobacteroides sp.]|nr:peptidylprolyl isomerase [Pseudobacteroides sp.]
MYNSVPKKGKGKMTFKKIILLILSLFIIVTTFGCSSDSKVTFDDDTAAFIGNEKVTKDEFIFYLKNAKRDMEQLSGVYGKEESVLEKFWQTKVAGSDPVEVAREKSLASLQELKILLSHAKAQNLELDQQSLDKIKEHMDGIIKDNGQGDRSKAEKYVQDTYGVSFDRYEAIYKEYVLAYEIFVNKFKKDLNVSNKEIEEYYNEHKDAYDRVISKHVLIRTTDKEDNELPQEQLAEKKKLAEEILQKAKNGEDFDSLVKEYSEDEGSKEKNGEVSASKGMTVKEYDEWIFSAKDGDIGLVKSKFGYHIIKFIKRLTLDDVKSEVKMDIEYGKYNEQLDKWIKDKAYEIKPNKKLIESIPVL